MSARPGRQQWLSFGADEHFELLHGGHRADVAVCQKLGARWLEGVYLHDAAADVVAGLAAARAVNVYQSQHGFEGRRVTGHVAALTSCFIDLDTYRVPGLESVTADELLDRVLAARPWLPLPTYVVGSGRGFYFGWLFDHPLPAERLAHWQSVEDVLVEALAPWGADGNARDAARVLRVVGTVNGKNGEPVTGYVRTGNVIPFARLEAAVLRGWRAMLLEQEAAGPPAGAEPAPARARGLATEAQRQQYLRHLELHRLRMFDCATLARLRGSPRMADCRARLLYVLGTSLAWYCSTRAQAEQEVLAFCDEHFAQGRRYGARQVRSVFERMEQARQGIAQLWNGQRVDRRYRLRNSSILAVLEVTAAEQEHMRTIIGPAERNRRRTARRRAAGVEPREAYQGRAAERRSEALRLRQAGLTQTAIAEQLGVSQAWVSRLLKASHGGGL